MTLEHLVRDIERLAQESATDGIAEALRRAAPADVAAPAAIALSSDHIPSLSSGHLAGRAAWIGPLAVGATAIVAGRDGQRLVACALPLDGVGVTLEVIHTAALRGVAFGNATFDNAPCREVGETRPIMARVRLLLAAAGLGMGRRALHEALATLRAQEGRPQGAGGEQTVQGLLADAATELEAAAVLIDQAAGSDTPSLAEASMAKLLATEATQRAVARATQVIGAASFTEGHIVERLAQDVRALELFAGRTEALREAIATDVLPHS